MRDMSAERNSRSEESRTARNRNLLRWLCLHTVGAPTDWFQQSAGTWTTTLHGGQHVPQNRYHETVDLDRA
jgi:hypothetical protein